MVFQKGETSKRNRNFGKSILFSLNEDTKQRLELLASRRQLSQGAICRYAITKFLEEEMKANGNTNQN